MLNNYEYFLTLAEERNITRAAEKLFISHQCLSKYLKNLENEYGVPLFDRKPRLTLTAAGQAMYGAFRAIELTEQNLAAELANIKQSDAGRIRFGITEGRYPILVPKVLKQYRLLYPHVELEVSRMTSVAMQEAVLNNELDLYMAVVDSPLPEALESEVIMEEELYLVISENMLREYFPDTYPECKTRFRQGADLRLFQHVPFVLNHEGVSSRSMLDRHLEALGISLRCINKLTQPDIHHRLTAEDYAASFCLTMYLPEIRELNDQQSHLNVFPIRGLREKAPLALIYHRGKTFPAYTKRFMALVKEECR